MWLERFSGQSAQSTPSGGSPNRPYSPSPRKSFQLGPSTLPRRPGLPSRTTSLSAASLVGSTDSLPAAARIPGASNLRRDLASSPATDVQDPVDVLERILGPLPAKGQDEGGDIKQKTGAPDAIDGDIDFGGLSLEQFANARPQPASTTQPPPSTDAAVEDFEKEKDRFEDLHKSIVSCDEVLSSVETYLTSFQADLAAVAAEIETLQNRSTTLNTKLENRKVVEKVLAPEVEAFGIPPAAVRKIAEGTVDDSWVRALEELEKRSRSIDAKLKEGKDIKAAQDIRPLVDDVSNKAVERIRDYVVAQIKALRSPSINAQIIQQNSFLRYRGVFGFLAQRQPQLGEEISQAYINTMRWYYLNNFTRYRTALDKLNIHNIDQTEAIAADPARKTVKPGAPPHDAFSIGRRTENLRTTNDTALSSYLAEEDKGTHYLEVPFRAFNLALVDNASAEYSFLTEFFTKQSFHATNRKFNEIFQPTFELGQALTRQLVEQSVDALGILTCVRLNQHFAFELQRRKVPAVEGYINGTNMLLWPRFQRIIDVHCESVRKLTASLSGKPAGSALSLTSSSASSQSTAPHPLTQRFANFLQGILSLSSEAGDDEPIGSSLGRLRKEYEAFLVKQSKSVPEARKRDRFLYNNYSLVCTIVADTEGKMAEEFKGHFAELKDALSVD
ncbi:hypothetical protein WHR41_05635 [Cladosporium halotolerans]|uniref:Vps52-domain-containing protein n=1 Tax=Cladosporium halotolerans TaxID=1052096 RepID=A0AB34KMX6_9PEZI